MDEQQIALWYRQAEARWRHLPAGEEREQRVQHTFSKIREEHEQTQLPQLERGRAGQLLEEATLDVFHRAHCWPQTDAEQALFDAEVDELFNRLVLQEREQRAPLTVRARLMARRLERRWLRENTIWRLVDASVVTKTAKEIAEALAGENDPGVRWDAEQYAAAKGSTMLTEALHEP